MAIVVYILKHFRGNAKVNHKESQPEGVTATTTRSKEGLGLHSKTMFSL
jgi:hypothetical protein